MSLGSGSAWLIPTLYVIVIEGVYVTASSGEWLHIQVYQFSKINYLHCTLLPNMVENPRCTVDMYVYIEWLGLFSTLEWIKYKFRLRHEYSSLK